jgi:hypothetical protein
MTYIDSLQVAALVLVVYAVPGMFLMLFARGLFNVLHIALLVFFVFPAIAVLATKVPFRGFRLALILSQNGSKAAFAATSPSSLQRP